LFVISTDYLPILLAQHLFTSFMWTIAGKLPWDFLRKRERGNDAAKVDSGTFDLYTFEDTWYRPKLSNARLDTFVKYAESGGLGSASDILLCMVPALSFTDRLPNERMLSLMPRDFQQIQGHGWAQTATFYYHLLELSTAAAIEDQFAVAAVVEAMEFVYLACEPFTKDIKPDGELDEELKKVVGSLAKSFDPTLSKLSPVYDLQKRLEDFQIVFRHYAEEDEEDCPKIEFPRWGSEERTVEESVFLKRIGVTSTHLIACEAKQDGKDFKAKQAREMECKKSPSVCTLHTDRRTARNIINTDIFGWTALHYAATGKSLDSLEAVLNSAKHEGQPIHRWQNRFKRSPIHLAALRGNNVFLKKCLKR
jgi:hypothetical protein